ncbi:MAG: type IV pilus twitching motility protein PilT [Desulfobacterales bacterium]|nr:type IV pilus twitching motility protein PilT [Desulfobacterales bacterium]
MVTLEDPVEFSASPQEGHLQPAGDGQRISTHFASGLRAALRQAPKVILVGEMRDRETVEIGLSAAETGHLVAEHPPHRRRRADRSTASSACSPTEEETADPHPPGRHAPLDRLPAPAAQGRRRARRGLRNHGIQPAGQGHDPARRSRRARPSTRSSRPATPSA